MDVDKLKSGEPYKNLKDSIVIFICTFDPFSAKKPKYEFKNIDITNGKIEPAVIENSNMATGNSTANRQISF